MSRRWWDAEETKPAESGEAMVRVAKVLEADPEEQLRNDRSLLYARMYEQRPISSLYQFGGQAVTSGAIWDVGGYSCTWNVLRSVISAAASQVTKSIPRPRFVTTGANFKQRRKAKLLQQFTDGLFHEANVARLAKKIFIDGTLFGRGAVQVVEDEDRVRLERVIASELYVDPQDALYGEPRTLYRRRFVSRDVLLRRYGRKNEAARQAIANAKGSDPLGGSDDSLIPVWEAWHLKSGSRAKDGVHVVGIEGGTLYHEDWPYDWFPIITLAWDEPIAGFHGHQLAADLYPIQIEINKLLIKIEKSQRRVAVPHLAVQRGSKVSKVDNEAGSRIEYNTTPPQFISPQALGAETYNWVERQYRAAFELAHISPATAAGQKEVGLNGSALALREAQDIQAAQFAQVTQRWEQFFCELAKRMIAFARAIYRDNREYRVSAPGTTLLEQIDWKQVDMDEDEYQVQVQPASILPSTPAGRLAMVQDLVQAGIMSPEAAAEAFFDLDPEGHMSLETAARKDLTRMCERMLYDGKYEPPERYMDLAQALKLATQYLLMGRSEGAEPKHLDLLLRFLEDVQALQAELTPPPEQQAPAAAVPLGAAPVPPTGPAMAGGPQ